MKILNLTLTSLLLSTSLMGSVNSAPIKRRFTFNFRPPSQTFSTFTIGGAVRADGCAMDRQGEEITALLADSTSTTSTHPDFFVSVPALTETKNATLIVRDKGENYYETQKVSVPEAGGIIQISLDESKPALEIGKNYEWIFNLHCDSQAKIDDPFVNGVVSPVAIEDLSSMNSEEKLAIFAQSNIWYDSLSEAYKLKKEGVNEYWEELNLQNLEAQ